MELPKSQHVWSTAHSREAFTLVELLIVISIITVLAALVAGATVRYIGTQRESNTRTTIGKVYKELRSQWDQVLSDARADVIAGKVPPEVLTLAGNDTARANVIYVKLKLRQQFPMYYAEILSPTFAGGVDKYFPPPEEYVRTLRKYLNLAPNASPPWQPTNQPAESGACLLIALTTKSRAGKVLPMDIFSSQEIADTNADGAPELVDGWGHPLIFYRWPTANDALPPLNPQNKGLPQASWPQFQDPEDPTGTLLAPVWNHPAPGNTGLQQFEQMCHLVHDLGTGNPKSTYMLPVVASTGEDGVLGIAPDQPLSLGPPVQLLPDPMQVAANTSTGAVTGSSTPQTVTLANQCLFYVGQSLIVDGLNAAVRETVTVTAVPASTQVSAVFRNSHSMNFPLAAAGADDNIYSYRVVPK
jgi:prepilin-type N-terminal cleavage/methylation domain-containing protein